MISIRLVKPHKFIETTQHPKLPCHFIFQLDQNLQDFELLKKGNMQPHPKVHCSALFWQGNQLMKLLQRVIFINISPCESNTSGFHQLVIFCKNNYKRLNLICTEVPLIPDVHFGLYKGPMDVSNNGQNGWFESWPV